jgi:hypothetical protein
MLCPLCLLNTSAVHLLRIDWLFCAIRLYMWNYHHLTHYYPADGVVLLPLQGLSALWAFYPRLRFRYRCHGPSLMETLAKDDFLLDLAYPGWHLAPLPRWRCSPRMTSSSTTHTRANSSPHYPASGERALYRTSVSGEFGHQLCSGDFFLDLTEHASSSDTCSAPNNQWEKQLQVE